MLKANRVMAVKKVFWLGAAILATGFFATKANAVQPNVTPRQNVQTRFTVDIDPVLNVTIPDRFEFTMHSDSILHYSEFTFGVTTNNITGYKAYASVADTDFVKSDNPDVKLSTLEYITPNSTEDFPLNRWGLNFPAMDPDRFYPASQSLQVEDMAVPVQDHIVSAVIGARINGETPAGNYLCTIIFQITPNVVPDTIRSIQYMQEMNAEVANSMQEDVAYQLRDSRDDPNTGKPYWVVKHDGQIIMQQNLDLIFKNEIEEGLPVYTTLAPATSDVAADRTMTTVNPWGNSDSDLYYHSEGQLYYPDGYKGPEDATTLSPYSEDLKYSAGSYYSWSSATAGSGISVNTANTIADESVCPKGWRLPLPSEADLMATGRPLVRSGHYDSTTGNIIGIYDGSDVDSGNLYLWTSSTGDTATDAKYILITSSSVSVVDGSRTDGFSVRCVADPPNEFTLTYDANGGSNAPAGYSKVSWDESNDVEIALDNSTNPTLSGKDFLGWARTADANTPDYFVDGDEVTLYPNTPVTLYAVWRTPCNSAAADITDAVCLQDVNSTVAATMTNSTAYQLMDYRDGKNYWITNINGEVWMTQNLDFEISAGGTRLVPATSDVTELRTLAADSGSDIRYVDGGNFYFDNATTKTDTTSLVDGDIAWHYHIGSFYSWAAATANAGANEGYSTESICPKGWTLPTFAQISTMITSEHVVVDTTNIQSIADESEGDLTYKADLDTASLYASPYYITLTGYSTEYGRTVLPGSAVRIWSSNEANEGHAESIYIYASSNSEHIVQNLTNENKNSQYTVRCVLK